MATRGIRVIHKKRGNRRSGSRKMGRLGELIFFATFFVVGLVGLALVVGFIIIPEFRSAKGFIETYCVVKEIRNTQETNGTSTGQSNPSKKENSQTYGSQIRIEYEVDGQKKTTWTHGIASVYSKDSNNSKDSGEEQGNVDRFEVGETYVCWYDPHNPKTAVLVKGFSWFGLLVGLIPLSFLLIGGGGLIYGMFHWGKSAERRAAIALRTQLRRDRLLRKSGLAAEGNHLPSVPRGVTMASSPGNTYPFRLPVSVLPAWKLLGMLAVCLIWNGIVAVPVSISIKSFLNGSPEWGMSLFTLLFLACGGFLIFLLVKQFLIATSVGVTFVEVSAHPFLPGDHYRFLLHQAGRLQIKKLEAILVCREKARYHQGTDTRTENRIVFEQTLFCAENFEVHRDRPFEAKELFGVPEGVMHSFVGMNNEVSWAIEIRGTIARWPTFTRTFPVIVHPARSTTKTIRLDLSTVDKQTNQKLTLLKRLG